MAILTRIDNVPLFTTPLEALEYGSTRNLVGYHTHIYNGVIGYMAGATHGQAASSSQGSSTSNQITSQGGSGSGGGY
jgi:hypothetical protein|tara:strand:- start:27 stop:257 length:231 start_codon:yes stop_codon:yes gene_type:complete